MPAIQNTSWSNTFSAMRVVDQSATPDASISRAASAAPKRSSRRNAAYARQRHGGELHQGCPFGPVHRALYERPAVRHIEVWPQDADQHVAPCRDGHGQRLPAPSFPDEELPQFGEVAARRRGELLVHRKGPDYCEYDQRCGERAAPPGALAWNNRPITPRTNAMALTATTHGTTAI